MTKAEALKKVDEEYYDRNSPHYKDNKRFRWAVEAIEKTFRERDLKTSPAIERICDEAEVASKQALYNQYF